MPSPPTIVQVRDGSTAQVLADVLARVQSAGPGRWLLVATSGAALAPVVAEVLSGRAPVFGLAGVVLTGAGSRWSGDPLPVLLTDDQSAEAAIEGFWSSYAGRGPAVPADVAALLASDRVSARTRGVHARRVLADDPAYAPVVLDAPGLDVLRLIAERVVPQAGDRSTWIDLAARVDAQLGAGAGDGWRNAALPADPDAYRLATAQLAGLTALTDDERDAVLTEVAAGEHDSEVPLSGEQLAAWFEDARVDLVRQWLAHPATMARVGYDGFANGGDGPRKQGFVHLELGSREDWEPTSVLATGATR